MYLKNKKINYKLVLVFLLQIVAMSFIFVFITDRQTIFIIKDFVYSLNLGTDVYAILGRVYVVVKMMFDIPSSFALFVFLLNLVCGAITLKVILFNNCPKKVSVEDDKIETPKYSVESILFTKNFSYLENHRLLN